MADFEQNEVDELAEALGESFTEEGQEYQGGDEMALLDNPPDAVSFPWFTFGAAALKDLADIILDLTGVGVVVVEVLSLILDLFLFFWTLDKANKNAQQPGFIEKMWKDYFVQFLIELIPFINLIPANSAYVLRTYFNEKKSVDLIRQGVEKIKSKPSR